MDFRFIPIFIVGLAVVCHTLPFPQEDVENDVEPRYGVQSSNINNQNHRLPDRPRAPAPNPGPGCRIEYETIYEIVEDETTSQKCQTEFKRRCETKLRQKCTPYTDTKCSTKYRQQCRNWTEKKCTDTWRNECSQQTKEECNENTRPIKVPYVEDECFTKKEKRCEKHWEERSPGKKVWVENTATCKYYDASECAPVTKYRTEQEKYTQCSKVPYQHCDRVKDTNCRNVPQQKCNDVPYQDCQNIQRERCVPESYQECDDVPEQKCRDEHKKTPRQVAKQIPIRVCGNHRTAYNEAEENFGNSNVFDIRTTDGHDPEDDAEVIAFGQQKEKIDPGFLQQKEDVEDIIKEKTKDKKDSKKETDADAISFGR
jgi:hypothetical protein